MKVYKKGAILSTMKIKSLCASLLALLIFSGCALITDEYQQNQKKAIAFLLEDLPMPDDVEIIKAPTFLLGTGEAISGRIISKSGYSPAENLIFYGNEASSTGWTLESSKVGEEVTLVYSKSGRFATIYITPRNTIGGFFVGDVGSNIDITIVHPDAVGIQNPYSP